MTAAALALMVVSLAAQSATFLIARAYYAAGDTANAIATINKAVALYPAAAASGAAAIAQIKGTAAGK